MTERPHCAFRKPTGHQCGLWPRNGSVMCFWHDPAMKERAAEARRLTWANRQRREHHTPRQIQALRAYVAGGAGYSGAARRLNVSEAVVQSRVRRLRIKVGVATTEQLIYVGAVQGWLELPDLARPSSS